MVIIIIMVLNGKVNSLMKHFWFSVFVPHHRFGREWLRHWNGFSINGLVMRYSIIMLMIFLVYLVVSHTNNQLPEQVRLITFVLSHLMFHLQMIRKKVLFR